MSQTVPRAAIAPILLLVCAGATIVQSAAAQDDASWAAPAAAVQRANPLPNRSDIVAGGRKLFEDRCATCHGHDGRGTQEAPDLGATYVQRQKDGALFWKITQGNTRTGMPTFSFLPELQRWQLVLALRELGSTERERASRLRR